jgi:DNA-binding LytR/AlgR family response regulator
MGCAVQAQAQQLGTGTPKPLWLTLVLNILLGVLLFLSWLNFIKVRKRGTELWLKHEALMRENEKLTSTLEAIQIKKNSRSKEQQEGDKTDKDKSVSIFPKRPSQLNAEHISHIWVEGNYIYYKHKDESNYILKRDRLKNVYTRLQKHHFVQTHKSYLVNMAMVKHVSWKEIILKDGSKVPLSRKHKEEFRSAYQTFHEKK